MTPYQVFLTGHPKLPVRPARDDGQFPIGEWQKLASQAYNGLSAAEHQLLRSEAERINQAEDKGTRGTEQSAFGPISEEQRAQYVMSMNHYMATTYWLHCQTDRADTRSHWEVVERVFNAW